MNCFTLYWNKLGILTWSVSWAADNEQLRDSNNLNLYSCLKGMSMTIFQNLPYPCEIDKYANNTPLPHLGFPTTRVWSAAAIRIPGQTWGQKAVSALTASTSQLISPGGAGSSTRQVHFPLELLPPSSSWQTLQVLFFLQPAARLILLSSRKGLHLQKKKHKNNQKLLQRHITEEALAVSWMLM